MDKTLRTLFECQKFFCNMHLAVLVNDTEKRYKNNFFYENPDFINSFVKTYYEKMNPPRNEEDF